MTLNLREKIRRNQEKILVSVCSSPDILAKKRIVERYKGFLFILDRLEVKPNHYLLRSLS